MLQFFACFAAINGFLAVALGAFAAHGLKGKLDESLLSAFNTGVQYQFYHTLALLALALFMLSSSSSRWLITSSWFFVVGMVFFCGSLYFIALGGPKWLGPITPLGGTCFMIGWLILVVYFFKALLSGSVNYS